MAGRPGPGGGGKKGGGKQRPKGALTRRATNNVQLQDAGQANLLQQQLQQAQQDYLRSSNAAGSIYPGAQESIGDLQRPQFDRIGNEFDQALGTVQSMFGGGEAAPYMAPGEGDAGMALGGAYGEAGHTMLANADAREGMYRSSAQRDAGLKQQYAQDTLLQQMQDTVQGYNNSLGQLRADDPWQIAQERDTLWDQAQQQKALASKLASDKAFSEWLQGQASGMAGAGGGGGGGGHPSGPGGSGVPTNSSGRPDWGSTHGYDGPYTGPDNGAPSGSHFGDPRGSGTDPIHGQPWTARAHQINQMGQFEGLPDWLQNVYRNAQGHNRWALVENDPRHAQIFRRTRPHVQDLWQGQQEQEGDRFVYHGRGAYG